MKEDKTEILILFLMILSWICLLCLAYLFYDLANLDLTLKQILCLSICFGFSMELVKDLQDFRKGFLKGIKKRKELKK